MKALIRPPGKELRQAAKKLHRYGWRADKENGGTISPHSKITYTFEQACRIENINVPAEHPDDAMHEWIFR